ncbi:MAG: sulfurtransferase, partial [Bacteroidetes bacterium]
MYQFGPLVSIEWLNNHLYDKDLLIFDASMDKVASIENNEEDLQIPSAQFFDIKHVFSDVNAPFPNTVPYVTQFTKEARKLGVNSNSKIVVYDDKGIYSSA